MTRIHAHKFIFQFNKFSSLLYGLPPRFLFHLSLFSEMRKENNKIGFHVSVYTRKRFRDVRCRQGFLYICSSTNNNKSKIALNEKIAFSLNVFVMPCHSFRKVFITRDFITISIMCIM